MKLFLFSLLSVILFCGVSQNFASAATVRSIIFVTRQTYNGDMKSINNIDNLCETEASQYGLSGFRALISTTGLPLRDRIPIPKVGDTLEYVNAEFEVVAADSDALFTLLEDGTLPKSKLGGLSAGLLRIDGSDPSFYSAWTGSDSAGIAGDNCNDWTTNSTASQGLVGKFRSSSESTYWFTSDLELACSQKRPLICVYAGAVETCDGKPLARGTGVEFEYHATSFKSGRSCFLDDGASGFTVDPAAPNPLCCPTSGKLVKVGADFECAYGCNSANQAATYAYYTLTTKAVGNNCYVGCRYLS